MLVTLKDRINSQNLNTQILDGIADMVRIVDLSNRIVFFNRSMEETFDGEIDRLLCPVDEEGYGICDLRFSERTLQTGEIIQREERIGEGYFSVKTSPILGDDGLIQGAIEVFRNKTREKKLQIEIVNRNKNMTREMHSASSIQRSLLPSPGRVLNIDYDLVYEPAEILSGDMVDIFEISEDKLAFYMADSVGHGFSSSMTTMFIYQALRNMPQDLQEDPVLALGELQDRFAGLSLKAENYFTIVYGVYNKKTCRLDFANAGHNCPPLVLGRDGVREVKLRGYPINPLFKEETYDQAGLSLEPGDQVLLLTDGAIECLNKDQDQYGLARVKEAFLRNDQDFLAGLEADIHKFSYGKLEDDMSLLWLKLT